MALRCDPWTMLYWIPLGLFLLNSLNFGNVCRIRFPLFQIGGQETLNDLDRNREVSWG